MSSAMSEEAAGTTSPIILIVMGVSGSGKTTVAALLAGRLHWKFQEGDALHPQANVDKMHDGVPLTDADRLPWLDSIAALVDRWSVEGVCGIITCSALKRAYRDRIRAGQSDVEFVYLRGAREMVSARITQRMGHFMPASLLDSQFATLEEPDDDEPVITVDIGGSPDQIVEAILTALQREHRELRPRSSRGVESRKS
jgi:carbohydrate kinase (thermoresistant glucokinase family)